MPEIDVDEERGRLSSLNPLVIVDYVKSSIDILVSVGVEDAMIEQEMHFQQMQDELDQPH